MKLFQTPSYQTAISGHFGILQVVKQLQPYLDEESNFAFVDDPQEADVILSHAGAYRLNPLPHQSLIAICHGLYPTADHAHPAWFAANNEVIRNLKIADKIIVPSEWVARMIYRETFIEPLVLQWGIKPSDWADAKPSPDSYVLWNKNRADDVCTPYWIEALAAKVPHQQFVSTFGQSSHNLRIIGPTMHNEMTAFIKGAGVYLATTKETGDIGSREALASGVPVLGFAQGALLDFVQHGVNGYLAKPHDLDDLANGLRYIQQHWPILSANAKKLAQNYTWHSAAEGLIQAIQTAYFSKQQQLAAPLVSVVIPCHNYSQYVASAIQSVLAQEGVAFELVVVDDKSSDNSVSVIQAAIQGDSRARLICHTQNKGVAETRNTGLRNAHGKYVLCLDADDILNKDTLRHLSAVLESDPFIGIAYGGIAFTDPGLKTDWLTAPFDYEAQVNGTFNQIPTCCMFRRLDALRLHGYRSYMQPAEDADLFTRLLTFTGKTAKKAFEHPAFFYRHHSDSLSNTMRIDPYRERGLPSWGASNRPFIAPSRPGKLGNPVKTYDYPVVGIRIETDKETKSTDLLATVDSLLDQTTHKWRLVFNAPLGLRLKAGTRLAPDFLEQAFKLDKWPKDHGQFDEVMDMACCGQVEKRELASTDEMVLVEWTYQTNDNPIPSPTNQRNADGRLAVYRGNIGSGPLYIYKADYESQKNQQYGLWKIVPDIVELDAVPLVMPAPNPPLLILDDGVPTVHMDASPDDEFEIFEANEFLEADDSPELASAYAHFDANPELLTALKDDYEAYKDQNKADVLPKRKGRPKKQA